MPRYVRVNPIRIAMPQGAPKELDYWITDEQAVILDERDKRSPGMVIVEMPSAGMVLCQVVVLSPAGELSERANKWIVDVVDDRQYRKRRLDEKRRAEIMKELAEKQSKLEAKERFKRIAEQDPEAKALLEELDGLS